MTSTSDDAEVVWRNWSGRHATTTARLHHARSEDDAAAVAAAAAARGSTVRVAGAGHSHSPLVPTGGTIVDLGGLAGVVTVDTDSATATVRAGTPVHALGAALAAHGLGLVNQGDIDRQAIAGACATGTHGTGATLGNLSTAVVGARIALASGDLVDCSATVEPDLWQLARLNLGAAGIVTRLDLAVRPAYRLAEKGFVTTLDDALDRIDDLAASHRHVEFFWFPLQDRAVVKVADETDEQPVYPLGPEGRRVAWSHEVLPNHRTWLHTETEYAIDAADGPACLRDVVAVLRRNHPEMPWPLEYRFVAADDVWLSPANGRPTVTVSVHQDIGVDDGPLFRDVGRIFDSYGGRPHWGKVHHLDGAALATVHPDWDRWWEVRDHYDPDGVFLNDHLRRLRRPLG